MRITAPVISHAKRAKPLVPTLPPDWHRDASTHLYTNVEYTKESQVVRHWRYAKKKGHNTLCNQSITTFLSLLPNWKNSALPNSQNSAMPKSYDFNFYFSAAQLAEPRTAQTTLTFVSVLPVQQDDISALANIDSTLLKHQDCHLSAGQYRLSAAQASRIT